MLHTNSTTLLAWIAVFLLIIGFALAFRRDKSSRIGIVAFFACMGICLYILYGPVVFNALHLFGYGK